MAYITDVASIFTPLALIIAIVELGITIFKNYKDKKHDKCKDTLDAYRELQRDVFDKLAVQYTQSRIKEVAEHYRTESNRDDYYILGTYTAKIEHFCVGVTHDIYDWETVYELSHGFLDGKIRDWMGPLMDKKTSFYGKDPFENTRKVFAMMDKETQRRNKGK